MHWSGWILITLWGLGVIGAFWEWRAGRAFVRRHPAPGRLVDVGGRQLHLLCAGDTGPTIVVEQGDAAALALPGVPVVTHLHGTELKMLAAIARGEPTIDGPYAEWWLSRMRAWATQEAADFMKFPKDVAGLVMVDAIEETIAFHPDYQRFLRRARPFMAVLRGLAAIGLLRAFGTLFGGKPRDADAAAMSAATARPSFFAAIADDMASLRRPAENYGTLGDVPLIVITHGKPFPGPFAALEPFWRAGQERFAALSTRGTLRVAENSSHMIATDEPAVVLEALREMAAMVAVRPGFSRPARTRPC